MFVEINNVQIKADFSQDFFNNVGIFLFAQLFELYSQVNINNCQILNYDTGFAAPNFKQIIVKKLQLRRDLANILDVGIIINGSQNVILEDIQGFNCHAGINMNTLKQLQLRMLNLY